MLCYVYILKYLRPSYVPLPRNYILRFGGKKLVLVAPFN